MHVLVLNCGSSSLKFAVIDPRVGSQPLVGSAGNLGGAGSGMFSWSAGEKQGRGALPGNTHGAALDAVTGLLRERPALRGSIRGVGHRVAHGGESFTESSLIDASAVRAIESVSHLAPLHNPPNLLGIRAAQGAFPELPQVAVFDTAFHQSMPERAYLYALPRACYEEHGVRRYGFHGTSHRYVVREAARLLGVELGRSAFLTAHLGNGCSAAAILDGRSVDTTMGMTPLEGLVMGTRSGDVDPGLHAYLAERLGSDVVGVTALLNSKSGLLGLSGLSNDMRELIAAEAQGHAGAKTAIEVFCYRLAKQLASLSVALGRLDALVFTGGIGEHSVRVRERVLKLLSPLGFALDAGRNEVHGAGARGLISKAGAAAPLAMVVPTNEELLIAEDAARLIGDAAEEEAGAGSIRVASPSRESA